MCFVLLVKLSFLFYSDYGKLAILAAIGTYLLVYISQSKNNIIIVARNHNEAHILHIW